MKAFVVFAAAVVAAGSLAACGGTPKVRESEVEDKVKSALTEIVGRAPDSIDCPADLESKVGVEMRCVLADGDVRYGVTVTVTAVEGDTAKFDAVVDKQPLTATTTTTR